MQDIFDREWAKQLYEREVRNTIFPDECFQYMSKFFVGIMHCKNNATMLVLFFTKTPSICSTTLLPLFGHSFIQQTSTNIMQSFLDLNMTVMVPAPTKKDPMKMKEKHAHVLKEFMQSRYFKKYHFDCFEPKQILGAPPQYFDQAFNLYTGLPIHKESIEKVYQAYQIPHTYKPENHPAILAILDHIRITLCNNDDLIYQYILNWLAFILQNPGEKTQVMIVFVGPSGCGKSTFYSWLAPLFGNYMENIKTADLGSQYIGMDFNEKFLIAIDEWNVRELDRRQADGLLKNIVTDPSMRVEAKYVQAATLRSHNNLMASTNFAFNITPSSVGYFRRLLIVKCGATRTPQYYQDLHEMIGNNKDKKHRFCLTMHLWAKFLLDRDIRKFKPSHFPITQFQIKILTSSWKAVQKWWYEVIQRGYIVHELRFQNYLSMRDVNRDRYANLMQRPKILQCFETEEQHANPSLFPTIQGMPKPLVYDQFASDMQDLHNIDPRKTSYSSTQFFHELYAIIPYYTFAHSTEGRENMIIFPPWEFSIRYFYSQNYAQGLDIPTNPFRLHLGENEKHRCILEEIHQNVSSDPIAN